MKNHDLPKWIIVIFVLFSIVGFLDATYLTYEHFSNPLGGCSVGGCQQVTTSEYSEVLGVPVSLFGMFYYLPIIVLLALYWALDNKLLIKVVSLITVAGLVASIYFVYLQILVIKAICPFCMLSATTSILLFVAGASYLRHAQKIEKQKNS